MSKKNRLIILFALFVSLVAVRYLATKWLYDPFQSYFDHDYLLKPIPEYHGLKLFFNMFIRYAVNTLISLVIIWMAFRDRDLLRFAVKFYLLAFVFLTFTFFVVLTGELKDGYLFAFYIRRFIIHPVLLLILFPAFFFKKGGWN
jgi:exosortase F-associated protein